MPRSLSSLLEFGGFNSSASAFVDLFSCSNQLKLAMSAIHGKILGKPAVGECRKVLGATNHILKTRKLNPSHL